MPIPLEMNKMRIRSGAGARIVAALLLAALLLAGAAIALPARGSSGTRTIVVDGQPVMVAVDAKTARVLVLSQRSPLSRYLGRVTMLDAGSAQLLRGVTVGLDPSAMAVDQRTGHIFVANGTDGTVSMLDGTTGTVLRIVSVGTGPGAIAIATRARRVFVATQYTTMTVLDADSGRLLGTIGGLFQPGALAVDNRDDRLFTLNGGTPGNALVPSVFMLDARSGSLLRTVPACASPRATPWALAVDERAARVFIGCSDGVETLDARSGAVLATVPIVAIGPHSVAVDARSGRVFVSNGASVSAIAVASGKLLHTAAAGSFMGGFSGSLAVDPRRGRVYAAASDGLYVFDARTGVERRRVPLDVVPLDLAVDERTGRVYAVNQDTTVNAPDRWAWLPPWARSRLSFLPPPGPHQRDVPSSVRVLDAAP